MITRTLRARWLMGLLAVALVGGLLVALDGRAGAASSDACKEGGFRVMSTTNGAVDFSTGGEIDETFPTASFGPADRLSVRGRYVEFDVRLSDFAVFDYAFTGAANEGDITGGRRTPVFASKIPDLRGVSLSGGVAIELHQEDVELRRAGSGVSMKIQAKDCAQGSIFEMEPERSDAESTTVAHTLATASDSGRVSIWSVASGGRMGFVSGDDAVETADFPFPVPAGSRLVPKGSVFRPLPGPNPPPAN